MSKKKLIYLASPYSHKDTAVKRARWLYATLVGAKLIEEGHHVFGPITESIAYQDVNLQIGHEWETWAEHDKMMIDRCDEMFVLTLTGWTKSKGVQAEIKYAASRGMPITYLDLYEYLPSEVTGPIGE